MVGRRDASRGRRHHASWPHRDSRIAAPTVDADVGARDLAGMQFSVGQLRANASGELTTPKVSFTADAPSAVVADEQVANLHVAGMLDGNVLTMQTLAASQAVSGGE